MREEASGVSEKASREKVFFLGRMLGRIEIMPT